MSEDTRQVDYIIVGQGIAGSLLAHELIKAKQSVLVIDPNGNNASKVAAGMFNPVVLKRFTPVWQANAQIATLKQTFTELESLCGKQFLRELPILRLFHNDGEVKTWQKKQQQPELSDLLGEIAPLNHPLISDPFAAGVVKNTGAVELKPFLAAFRDYLIAQNAYYEGSFDYSALKITDSAVCYQNITAKSVIFCEGFGIKNNPYFKQLPLPGNKGEVLEIKADLDLSEIVKGKVAIFPKATNGDNHYLLCASYHWTDKTDTPTDAAKAELLEKLGHNVDLRNIEVVNQYAGVRPTVIDRRPILGAHPAHSNLYILNGLGTRGVMLGATMAKLMTGHLLENSALPNEVDVNRFVDYLF